MCQRPFLLIFVHVFLLPFRLVHRLKRLRNGLALVWQASAVGGTFKLKKEMFVPDLLVVTAILTRRKPMLN